VACEYRGGRWKPLCEGLKKKMAGDENALQGVVLNQYMDEMCMLISLLKNIARCLSTTEIIL
jgi:hypothetical protein